MTKAVVKNVLFQCMLCVCVQASYMPGSIREILYPAPKQQPVFPQSQ